MDLLTDGELGDEGAEIISRLYERARQTGLSGTHRQDGRHHAPSVPATTEPAAALKRAVSPDFVAKIKSADGNGPRIDYAEIETIAAAFAKTDKRLALAS